MDGGTEWDAARNWLEMADREDLLELLSYLGVDMGSLPQEFLRGGGFLTSVATSSERAERWAPVFDTISPVKNY